MPVIRHAAAGLLLLAVLALPRFAQADRCQLDISGNDYVAPGDKRVLAHSRVIGGGQATSVTFPTSILEPGADYRYLCTFPGHSALMHGTFKFG